MTGCAGTRRSYGAARVRRVRDTTEPFRRLLTYVVVRVTHRGAPAKTERYDVDDSSERRAAADRDPRLQPMAAADRTVQLQQDAYDLLVKEAARRGVEPEALADELLRADLAAAERRDQEAALDALAEFRAGLPPADAVALVREGRAELEARHA